MPRTKVVKKPAAPEEPDTHKELILQAVLAKKEELILKITEERDKVLERYRLLAKEELASIPVKHLDMTPAEIAAYESAETSAVTCISKSEILNITKSVAKSKKYQLKRSRSFVDDEGYLTAESVNTGSHKSRSRTNTASSSRRTRSLSKGNKQKAMSLLKTPANKVTPPNTYGVVTPKCKPNTPQVILRRPLYGEMALSMQGSPLLTGAVATERVANVNIPLEGGRVLSLQPERGLRMSQVPDFDPEILKQLKALSENLDKVFAASGIRK